MRSDTDADRLRAEVDGVPWYHTIELPHGVVTPGENDLRPTVARLPIPPSLAGRRCLDVGTHDGFWAFEMERRGGSVVAIDLEDPARYDWPEPRPHLDTATLESLTSRRRAFWIAHEALGSQVERLDLSVYDLAAGEVGVFDFAFIGTLLHHLRDPVLALASIRRVVRGQLLVCAVFSVAKSVLYPRTPVVELLPGRGLFWNHPNIAGLKEQLASAGWEVVRTGTPFLERWGSGRPIPTTGRRDGPLRLLPRRALYQYGVPHVWMLAEPLPDEGA
jgi:tRNA (mo5U34)-methyltransferase